MKTLSELISQVKELNATRFHKAVHMEALAEAAPLLAKIVEKLIEQRDRAIDSYYKQEVMRSECKMQMGTELDAIVAKGMGEK